MAFQPAAHAGPAVNDPAYAIDGEAWQRRVSQRPLTHDEQRELVSSLRRTEHHAVQGNAEHAALEQTHQTTQRERLAAVQASIRMLPHYTRYSTTRRTILPNEDPVRAHLIAEFLRTRTAHRGRVRGSLHCQVPKFAVQRVERLYNPRSQEAYIAELQDVRGLCGPRGATPIVPAIDALQVRTDEELMLNEHMLYHGLPSDKFEKCFQQGLDPRYGGSHGGRMFGYGTYLASNSSKSDLYTGTQPANGERVVLVVRANLGEPYYEKLETEQRRREIQSWRMPPTRSDERGPLHSIVAVTRQNGGSVEHPEYIVFERRQCLPQYAIWYKHEEECFCSHCVESKILVHHPFANSSFTIRARYSAYTIQTQPRCISTFQEVMAAIRLKIQLRIPLFELLHEDQVINGVVGPLNIEGYGLELTIRLLPARAQPVQPDSMPQTTIRVQLRCEVQGAAVDIPILVPGAGAVYHLEQMTMANTGVRPAQQVLIVAGNILRDPQVSLQAAGVVDGSVLIFRVSRA